jgi:hypothetical protein
MTNTFYGATILLNSVPDENTASQIASDTAQKHFPDKEYHFTLSQSIPSGLSVESARELEKRKSQTEGSVYLIITAKR